LLVSVPRGYPERMLAAAALIGIVVLLAVGINRPVWLDEANSVLIAGRGFQGIVDSLRRENNLPGYYFLLSLWMRLFGDSEIALRSLSALFYLSGAGAAAALGKRLSGEMRCGWYSGFFYILSPLAVRNAQNIRMYALLGLLSGLSILAFLKLFADKDRSLRTWIGFVAVTAVGLLTHVWFGFVVVGQFLALLVWERSEARRFAIAAAVAAAPLAVWWGPYLIEQSRDGATDWMARLSVPVAVTAATEFYGLVPAVILYMLAAAMLARGRVPVTNHVRLLAVTLSASLAVPLLICAVKPIYWPGRYAIIALPALAALLGTTLPALPRPLLSGLCLLLMGFEVATHVAQRDAVPEAQLPEGQSDRTTASFLLQHAAPGDVIVFTSLTRAAADYYFRRAQAGKRFVEISFPQEVAEHLGWANPTVQPARQAALEAEAAATTGRLREIAAAGRKVWLYDGFAAPVSGILKEKIDSEWTLQNAYALSGPYHRRILEYDYRQSTPWSAPATP
jgi:mannosyltransferase